METLKTLDLGSDWILYPDIEIDNYWNFLSGDSDADIVQGIVIHNICIPVQTAQWLNNRSDIDAATRTNKKSFTCNVCNRRSSPKIMNKFKFIMSSYKND